jgi:hypothetical protein
MAFHTREMIREAIVQRIGISFMFARECPLDDRLCVIRLRIAAPHRESQAMSLAAPNSAEILQYAKP